MNIPKIIEALEQTDQLCTGLFNIKDPTLGCAITQLFYAAGKSREDIETEQRTILSYTAFFDGLLKREYGLDEDTIYNIWRANDVFKGSPKARHIRMIEGFKAFENDEVEEVWVDEEVEEMQPVGG